MRAKSNQSFLNSVTRGKQFFFSLVSIALACGLVALNSARAAEKKAASDKAEFPKEKDGVAEIKEPAAGDKEKAAAFVREHRSGLVFIKNKVGSGSGFIADMRGRKVLITNAHVMAGIKNPTFELLDRTPLRVGTASVAVGHDLVAFVVVEGGAGIPLVTNMDTEAQLGDAVVVLGNAQGGGVVNPLHGEITGVGPDRVEISAPFELGNSGSPIVHLPSGKVIEVAAYARLDSLLSGGEKLRRFGYRLDSVKTWQHIDWLRFYSEGDLAEKIENTTLELAVTLRDFETVQKKRTHNFDSLAIRNALDTYYGNIRQDPKHAGGAGRILLSSLREACRSDVAGMKGRFTYDYFRRQTEAMELIRGEFIKAIDKAVKQ